MKASKSIAQNRAKQDQLVKRPMLWDVVLSKPIAQNRVKQDQLVKKTGALGCGEEMLPKQSNRQYTVYGELFKQSEAYTRTAFFHLINGGTTSGKFL